MRGLANYIIRKRVPSGKNLELPTIRGKIGIAQGWISICINLFLFLIKLFYGFISNSIALIADAFHTLSDLASSGVVVFGFKMASKPADKEHPFGHGRAETIAALTLSILIGFTGFEFIKTSIGRLIVDEAIEINRMLFVVIIMTIILKECLARLSLILADKIKSDTLKADGIHHRSDMLSSLLVLVAFGGVQLGYPKMDAIMGLGVGAMMIFTAYKIVRSAIDDLLGKPMDSETVQQIKTISLEVEEVLNVHDIVVHTYGAHKFISLHLEIAEGKSPEKMHDIADQVEKKISKEMEADVVTHVDPVTVEGEEIAKIIHIIKKNLLSFNLDDTIQDLRIVKNHTIESILFQVPISVEFNKKEEFNRQCSLDLTNQYPGCKIIIEYKSQMSIR